MYSYDSNGNILSRCEYPYTVKNGEELSELTCKHFDYIYNGDRLIKILSDSGEEAFAYNNLGSPTTYRNKQLQWQYGRLLTKYGDTTFEYDGLGRRIKKGDIKYVYDSEGKLVGGSDGIYYIYDDKGIAGFAIPGYGFHFYRKDAQGNIIAILDTNGNVVVRYEYDAWGNHKVLDFDGNEITDPEHIGHLNPIRYRGYFYDEETGLYYLQTRYYDPTIGRFISQDSIEYADPQSINGLNLYAYCANNPVMNIDPTGELPAPVWINIFSFINDIIAAFAAGVNEAAKVLFKVASGIAETIPLAGGYGILNPLHQSILTEATNLQYLGGLFKTLNIISYLLLAVDIGISIYNNFTNSNLSASRKVTDTIVDTYFSVASFGAIAVIGAEVGGAIGTLIPVPVVGTVVGALVGALVSIPIGIGVYFFQKTSLYEKIKVGVNKFITETVPNAWNSFVSWLRRISGFLIKGL